MNDPAALAQLTYAMLKLCVLASLPVVIVAAVVGLIVGLAQAITQLQDQSLPFAAKFVAVAATLALTWRWTGTLFDRFVHEVFDAVARMG